jgi:hypothetical protein
MYFNYRSFHDKLLNKEKIVIFGSGQEIIVLKMLNTTMAIIHSIKTPI